AGKNEFSSLAVWLSCGSDLNKPSVGEVKSAAVGDCQVSMLVASFAALPLEATVSALICAVDFDTRDLIGRRTILIAAAWISAVLTSGRPKLLRAGLFANAEYAARGCEYCDHTANEIT